MNERVERESCKVPSQLSAAVTRCDENSRVGPEVNVVLTDTTLCRPMHGLRLLRQGQSQSAPSLIHLPFPFHHTLCYHLTHQPSIPSGSQNINRAPITNDHIIPQPGKAGTLTTMTQAPPSTMAQASSSINPHIKGLGPIQLAQLLRGLQAAKPGATQHSLFLELPPELRNRIHHLVLVDDEYINLITDERYTGMSEGCQTQMKFSHVAIKEPALLQCSSMIRNEATQMYYALNTFVVHNRRMFVRWVNMLGAAKQAMLKDIRTSCMRPPSPRPFWLLDIEDVESFMPRHGVMTGKDVIRIYRVGSEPEEACTASEIRALMTTKEWDVYDLLQR